MEENSTVTQQPSKIQNGNAGRILLLIIIITGLCVSMYDINIGFESKAIEAAEKYAKQSTYREIGIVPESTDSKVIYKDGGKRLICVRVALEKGSSSRGISYCVYTNKDYVINCTNAMGGDYDFKEHLEEVKTLFGL